MANGYGNGSIVQLDKGKDGNKPKSKCRKWRLVVSLGRDTRKREEDKPAAKGAAQNAEEPGKPKKARYRQKARNFTGTYTEAQAALRKLIEEIDGGEVAPTSKWTYDEYVQHFLEARKASGKFAERTIISNGYELGALGKYVGHLTLQQITPKLLDEAYEKMLSGDGGKKRPIGGTRLFNINRTAYIMFNEAVKKGALKANPLDGVDKPRKDTKERRALPTESYRKLLAALDPEDPKELAVLLCALLGLRRSEALAVSWGDVDFERGTINIHSSLNEDCTLKEPKTPAGFRMLPMAQATTEALMKRKAVQAAEFKDHEPKHLVKLDAEEAARRAGAVELDGELYDLAPEAPLICDEYGERFHPHTFSVWWAKNRAGYDVEGWSLHELRHTFLTAAAANGIHPSIMQQLAGHKSAQTTMDIYTHVNMTNKRTAVEALQAAYM